MIDFTNGNSSTNVWTVSVLLKGSHGVVLSCTHKKWQKQLREEWNKKANSKSCMFFPGHCLKWELLSYCWFRKFWCWTGVGEDGFRCCFRIWQVHTPLRLLHFLHFLFISAPCHFIWGWRWTLNLCDIKWEWVGQWEPAGRNNSRQGIQNSDLKTSWSCRVRCWFSVGSAELETILHYRASVIQSWSQATLKGRKERQYIYKQ